MALFYSKTSNLRITVENAEERLLPTGSVYRSKPGKRIIFKPGPLGGEYRTDDKKEIEFLRNHVNYNVSTVGGFFERGEEPALPRPTMEEIDDIVLPAIAAGDYGPIADLASQELETHNRPEVFTRLEKARDTIAKVLGVKPDELDPPATETTTEAATTE